jgi:hypothetical protein
MSLKTLVSTRDDLRICPPHGVTFKVVLALRGSGTIMRIVRPLIVRRRNGPIAWPVVGIDLLS